MALEKILKNSSGVPTGEYERIAGGTLYADNPIGTILPFGGTNIPAGFLLCNGAEVLKTDYAELYAVIGDAFGTASVNTKFVLPDLREATTKGVGLTSKSNNHYDEDGLVLGEFIEDRIKAHAHGIPVDQNSGSSTSTHAVTANANIAILQTQTVGDNTTEVKAVGVNFIIKATQVALPADLESAVEDAVEEVVGSWTVLKRASDVLETDMTGYKEALVYATNSYGTSTSNWHIVLDAYDSLVQFNGVHSGDCATWNPATKKLNVTSENSNCTVIAR